MATAWRAGGSGLVGGALLRRLLQDDHFDTVVSAGRRTLPIQEWPQLPLMMLVAGWGVRSLEVRVPGAPVIPPG